MARTESFGRGRIVQSILDTTSVPFTLKISKVPVEDNQFITINPDTTSEEIFFYTTTVGTAGEAGTLNITARGYNVADANTDVANQREHDENSEYKLALNHIIINDKVDSKVNNIVESEIKFSSTTQHGLVVNNMTTAERNALTAENGTIIYNTTTNVLQQFISGGWSDIGSIGVADASETVAGKVEIATNGEATAGTDTGTTGAPLVTIPSQLVAATPVASETAVGLVERATDDEALAGTDTTRYTTPKQNKDNYGWVVGPGSELLVENNVTASTPTTQEPYVKVKEFSISIGGTYTVSFTLTASFSNGVAGTVYVNGIAVGVERSVNGDTLSFTEDFTISDLDLVQLYIRNNDDLGGSNTNFGVFYNTIATLPSGTIVAV